MSLPIASSRAGRRLFGIFAWAYYAYLLFVIAFGAWVRISGSGAGCGKSWPSCQGGIVPLTHEVKTFIEYTHRLSSGLLGIFSLILIVWAFRSATLVRTRVTACIILWLVCFEALIGAGIVLRGLVVNDASVTRAVVISLHLANTLCLGAAAGLTAWWSSSGRSPSPAPTRGKWILLGLLVGLLMVSMAGAVTALGDTLFPVTPTEGVGFFSHVKEQLSPASHFLVRLRILHPLAAVLLSVGLLAALYYFEESWPHLQGLRRAAFGLVFTQIALGGLNILLGAPTWIQIVHLLVAQLLWLCFVLLTAALLLPMKQADR